MSKVLELVERIEKLRNESTQGDWTFGTKENLDSFVRIPKRLNDVGENVTCTMYMQKSKDAELISELVNRILTLTKIIRLQQEALDYYAKEMPYAIEKALIMWDRGDVAIEALDATEKLAGGET